MHESPQKIKGKKVCFFRRLSSKRTSVSLLLSRKVHDLYGSVFCDAANRPPASSVHDLCALRVPACRIKKKKKNLPAPEFIRDGNDLSSWQSGAVEGR